MKEVSLDDWVYGNSYRPIHGQYMGTPRDLVLSSMDEKRWSKLRMVLLAILNESQKTELLIKSLVAIGTYDLIDETCGETLVNLLDHSNQDVRRLAAAGLCYESVRSFLCTLGTPEKLQSQTVSQDHGARFVSLRALSLCDLKNDSVRTIFDQALVAEDFYTRMYACGVLDEFCGSPEIAFELLREMVKDPSDGVRRRVVNAMASLNKQDIDSLSEVIEMANDKSAAVREYVAYALREHFPDSDRAYRPLLDLLQVLTNDENEYIRESAQNILNEINNE